MIEKPETTAPDKAAERAENEQNRWNRIEACGECDGDGCAMCDESKVEQPVASPASIKLNVNFVTHDHFIQREADLYTKYKDQWPTRTEFLAAYEADKVDVANFELDEWAFLVVTLFRQYSKVAQPESPATMSAREFYESGKYEGDSDFSLSSACQFAEAFAAQSQPNLWKETVIDACVVNHLSWDENDPRKTLANLIAWECKVALDPLVSEEARKLQSQPSVSKYVSEEQLQKIAEAIKHWICIDQTSPIAAVEPWEETHDKSLLSILRASLKKGEVSQ